MDPLAALRSFLLDDSGAAASEYSVVAASLALAGIVIFGAMSTSVCNVTSGQNTAYTNLIMGAM